MSLPHIIIIREGCQGNSKCTENAKMSKSPFSYMHVILCHVAH